MGAQSAVVLRDVKKAFPLRGGLGLEVLDLEHLALPAGSCTVLRGPSGSGKTTLLNLVARITAPTPRTVHVADTDVFPLSEARPHPLRPPHIRLGVPNLHFLPAL